MINDYYDVFSRRNQLSRTSRFKEMVKKDAENNFKRFLSSSPDSIEVRVNNKYADTITVATILEKETETKVKRFFLCQKENNIKIGDYLYWDDTVWLTFMKTKNPIDAYDKFEAIECKHNIKWIDDKGALRSAPAFLIAQTDETVKANFKTWNSTITPLPNKNLEIIISRNNVKLGQRFLFEETAWKVVESDYISVNNILYLSLTEDRVDESDDNVENNIADYFVDLNKIAIDINDSEVSMKPGDTYTIISKVYLNGNEVNEETILTETDAGDSIELNNRVVTAKNYGNATVRISLKDNSEVYKDIVFSVIQSPITNTRTIIEGDSSIKWGRTKSYVVKKYTNGVGVTQSVQFSVTDTDGVLEKTQFSSECAVLTANKKNKTGTITLSAVIDNETITKDIDIISLWM